MELRELSDEELMERFRGGTAGAFDVLLERHGQAVFRFALRQHGQRELAEDLMQEVFLRVIKKADSFRRRSKFTTWLYTIARNVSVDAMRRNRHRRTVSLDRPLGDEPDSQTLYDVCSDGGTGGEQCAGRGAGRGAADQLAMDREFSARLEQALQALPPEQREVFVLRELQGLPFAEIGGIVGASPNTAKSRMRYALQSLSQALTDFR